MGGFIGDSYVSDYVNTQTGEALGVRALHGVGGLGVRVLYGFSPTNGSHILAENLAIINTESSEKLIIESN